MQDTPVKKNKTILYLIDDFQVGGAMTFLDQHAKTASHNGFHVIIAGSSGNLPSPAEQFEYARVIEIPVSFTYGSTISRIKWAYTYFRYVNRIYNSHTITCVEGVLPYSFLIALFHPKSWSMQRIYDFCGDIALEIESAQSEKISHGAGIRNGVRYILQYIAIRMATDVMTFSGYARALLRSRYPFLRRKYVTVIPGSTNILCTGSVRDTRANIRLVTISRFERRKGIDNLLQAASILRDKGVNFSLIIAGPHEPTYLGRFFELYEHLNLFTSVHFIHRVDEREMRELLIASDVCVLPSRDYETFGMITLHSLACGTPVVGTPTGATPEILQKIDKRFITRTIAPADIAKAILWYSRLDSPAKKKIQNTIKNVLTRDYNPQSISAQILNLYTHEKM